MWGWGTPAGRLRAARRANLIMAGAELQPGKHVLEVGCGTGLFTEMFAATGASIVAVDISPELLDIAKRRPLPSERVSFIAKPFEECAVDGPFDAVIGSSVLHHLDLFRSLEKIQRLLNPGGILSFAEPNYLNPQVFLERKLRFLPLFAYTSPDETAFVRWLLARTLRSLGFIDISITPFDWLHPAIPKNLIKATQRIGSIIERTPLLREFSGSVYIRARRPQ